MQRALLNVLGLLDIPPESHLVSVVTSGMQADVAPCCAAWEPWHNVAEGASGINPPAVQAVEDQLDLGI